MSICINVFFPICTHVAKYHKFNLTYYNKAISFNLSLHLCIYIYNPTKITEQLRATKNSKVGRFPATWQHPSLLKQQHTMMPTQACGVYSYRLSTSHDTKRWLPGEQGAILGPEDHSSESKGNFSPAAKSLNKWPKSKLGSVTWGTGQSCTPHQLHQTKSENAKYHTPG